MLILEIFSLFPSNQDLLSPLKSRRPSKSDGNSLINVEDDGHFDDKRRQSKSKNVAFDLGTEEGKVGVDAGLTAASTESIVGPKSAPPSPDPASLEKLYRRHIARYYARSAKKFDEVDDSLFPKLPGQPPAAVSPFLDDHRNEEIWRWLNRDFCKTKLDYFLSLCS